MLGSIVVSKTRWHIRDKTAVMRQKPPTEAVEISPKCLENIEYKAHMSAAIRAYIYPFMYCNSKFKPPPLPTIITTPISPQITPTT